MGNNQMPILLENPVPVPNKYIYSQLEPEPLDNFILSRKDGDVESNLEEGYYHDTESSVNNTNEEENEPKSSTLHPYSTSSPNQEKETNEKSKSFNPDLAHIEKIIPESDDSEPEKSDTDSDSNDSGDEASSESNWGDYSDVEIIPQSPKNEQSRKDESKYIDAF